MKSRLIVVAVSLLVFMPHVAVAQIPRAMRASPAAEPPPLPQQALGNKHQPDAVIARLFAFQPAIPLGPADVLKGYEEGMSMIAQRLSADLIGIMQANRANQITRAEAEYLIEERYQVAMMQHEVLGCTTACNSTSHWQQKGLEVLASRTQPLRRSRFKGKRSKYVTNRRFCGP